MLYNLFKGGFRMCVKFKGISRGLTREDLKVMAIFKKRSQDKCFYCGKKLKKKTKTVDHRIPLSKGGKTVKENLKPSCMECNSEKNEMLPIEFAAYRLKALGLFSLDESNTHKRIKGNDFFNAKLNGELIKVPIGTKNLLHISKIKKKDLTEIKNNSNEEEVDTIVNYYLKKGHLPRPLKVIKGEGLEYHRSFLEESLKCSVSFDTDNNNLFLACQKLRLTIIPLIAKKKGENLEKKLKNNPFAVRPFLAKENREDKHFAKIKVSNIDFKIPTSSDFLYNIEDIMTPNEFASDNIKNLNTYKAFDRKIRRNKYIGSTIVIDIKDGKNEIIKGKELFMVCKNLGFKIIPVKVRDGKTEELAITESY